MLYIFACIVVGIFFVLVFVMSTVADAVKGTVTRLVTPKGYRRYGDYKDSDGYEELRAEAYDVTPDWTSNAIEKVRNSSK